MKKRFLCAGLVALLGLGAIGLGACNETTTSGEDGYSIQITNKAEIEEEFSIYDSSRTLEVEITKDGEAQNPSSAVATGELTTESSNSDVVLVGGLVLTPVSEGEATVTVSYHGWTDTVDITVVTEPVYEHDWKLGTEYFLGIEYNDKTYYATGNTVGNYSYEGEMSTSMNKAARVTMEAGEEINEYYMSFVKDEVTYYITIEEVGGYIDLQYETTKSPIYWNAPNGIFVNADRSYFLCYNSTYGCLYASSISSWYGSSPIATLYEIPDEIPEDDEYLLTEQVNNYVDGSSYLLGVDKGETKYYLNGEMSGYYGTTVENPEEGLLFTINSVDGGVTLSTTIGGKTQYVGMSQSGSYTNFVYTDTATVLTYDSTRHIFTLATGEGDASSSIFLGTRSSYTTIGWYDISYLSGDDASDYYPIQLYSILYPDPTIGTYSGATSGWLGFTMSSVNYYFDGTVYNTNYLGVTDDICDPVTVTVGTVDDGYTLSFTDGSSNTQYLNLTESGNYRNLKFGTESYTWEYDTRFNAFITKDSNENYYFIGTYGTYTDLTMNDYGYLTGYKSTTNAQYVATMMNTVNPTAPTSITVSGPTTVYIGYDATYTTDVNPNVNGGVTWSVDNSSYASIDASGVLKGVAAGTVTVTATSKADTNKTGTLSVEVKALEGTEEEADFDALKVGATNNGSYDVLTGVTNSTAFTSCTITWDDGTGNNGSNTRVNTDYIQWYSGEKITFSAKTGYTLNAIVIHCTSSSYAKDVTVAQGSDNQVTAIDSNEAAGSVIGNNIFVTGWSDWSSIVVTNAANAQARISSISVYYSGTSN